MNIKIGLIFSLLFFTFFGHKTFATEFSFSAFGDIGATSATTKSLQFVKQNNINFTLAIGDMSYNNLTPESAWCNYIKTNLGTEYPFEILAGNHEDDQKLNGYIFNFANCLPDKLNSIGTYSSRYYFDYPAQNPISRFILISPGLWVGGIPYSFDTNSEHYNWLSNVIDDARSKNIKWVVVAMHENCVTVGTKICDIGEPLINLLTLKKVDLILQGHDHTYQRSKQLKCISAKNTYDSNCTKNDNAEETTYKKGDGPILVIAGNPGGASMYDINNSDPEKGYFVKALGNNMGIDFRTGTLGYETGRGVVKYVVNDSSITATYNMTTKQKSGLAFSDSFTIIDEGCVIRLSNGYCKSDIDYDGNNSIELIDGLQLIKKIFDNAVILSPKSKPDLNNDGILNLVDVLTFIQAILS